MKTLLNTYCVIYTEEHLKALAEHESWVSHDYVGDAIAYTESRGYPDFDAFDVEDLPDRTRVTVEQYIDLMADRITPWRLEEVGGEKESDCNSWLIECGQRICVGFFSDGETSVSIHYDYASIPVNITTFSELQTLIKFLTPKP